MIETETESGCRRVDVAVYSKDKRLGKPALVIELKRVESHDKLEKAAERALKQIHEKGYTAKYEKTDHEVIRIGMAFYGKKVALKYEV